MALIIKWNRKAVKHLDEAIEYIQFSSPANAEKIRRKILLTIDGLLKYPQKYIPISTKQRTMAVSGLLKYIITEYRIAIKEVKSELSVSVIRK